MCSLIILRNILYSDFESLSFVIILFLLFTFSARKINSEINIYFYGNFHSYSEKLHLLKFISTCNVYLTHPAFMSFHSQYYNWYFNMLATRNTSIRIGTRYILDALLTTESTSCISSTRRTHEQVASITEACAPKLPRFFTSGR